MTVVSETKAGLFNPKTFTLKNGLEVVVVENHLSKTVTVGVLYKVGTADDPSDHVGLAHFLEHMMFMGTKRFAAKEFNNKIMEVGGYSNAYTGFDQTLYYNNVGSQYLEMLLDLEADRMANLSFTEEQVKSERDVVMEERRMRTENHPFGVAYEAYLRACFWSHPYGVMPIGYPRHINSYTYENTRAHYDKWYAPNNAVLIISGDVTVDKVKPLVEKYFGPLKSKNLSQRVRAVETDHADVTIRIEQENPRNSLVIMNFTWHAPGFNDPNFLPLVVLADAIAGRQTRELYKTLVEDKKWALEVHADMEVGTLDPFLFDLNITLAPGVNPTHVEDFLKDYLATIVNNGPEKSDFEKARIDLANDVFYLRDGTNSAVEYFDGLACGMTLEQLENWPENIKKVSFEQVKEAAKSLLSRKPDVIMVLYPPKQASDQHKTSSQESTNS